MYFSCLILKWSLDRTGKVKARSSVQFHKLLALAQKGKLAVLVQGKGSCS